MEDTLTFLNLDEHPHEGPHRVGRCIEIPQSRRNILMKDRIVWKITLRFLNLDDHPHEGPHCVEDTLRFLNLGEHPREGPHCVEDAFEIPQSRRTSL